MFSAANSSAWRRQFLLFAIAVFFLGLAGGITESTFNNFLNDVFHITAKQRGTLEFPRELPGFLVAVFAGALFFLTEVRTAAFASFVIAIGLVGLARTGGTGENYSFMVGSMFVWSAGQHLFMPMQSSIVLALAGGKRSGTLMGRVAGYSTIAVIGGSGIVWLGMEYLDFNYSITFLIAAAFAVVAAFVLRRMSPLGHAPAKGRAKFVFRKEYSLFYVLCVLFGARKQVFITFGPLVLIKIFGQPPQTIAKLVIVASVLGIAFKPALGWMIDRLGERFVLMTDAFLLVGVCLGYGFGRAFLPAHWALYLAYTCFVMDMLLFAMEMARAVYLDKIARSRADVAPTLTLGITIDHTVSMSIPALGGLIWTVYGYPWVFAAAALVALGTFTAASRIRVPNGEADLDQAEAILEEERI